MTNISPIILLIISLVNTVLNVLGYQTINDELANNITAAVSGLITFIIGLVAAIKLKRKVGKKKQA